MKLLSFSEKRKNHLLELLVIFTCILALYGRVWSFGFVWDDLDFIVNNPYFRQKFDLLSVFKFSFWKFSAFGEQGGIPFYRPLVIITYFLEYKLWGLSASGYHLTNVALHLCSTTIIWGMTKKLEWSRAARIFVCTLFAFHPAQVSSISFISCQGDLLATLFILLGFWFWLFVEKWQRLTYVFIFLAMLSKESAFLAPLVLILSDVTYKNKRWNQYQLWFPILLWIPYVLLRTYGLGHFANNVGHWQELYFSQGSYKMLRYFGRVLYPSPAPVNQILKSTPPYLNFTFHLMLAFCFYVLFSKTKKNTFLRFFMITFLLFLLPTGDWFNSGFVRFSDQLLYLPMVFICLTAGYCMTKEYKLSYFLFPFLLVCTVISFSQISIWKNDVAFWENELKYHPNIANVRLNYDVALIESGQVEKGCKETLEYLDLAKNDGIGSYRNALYDLGNCNLENHPDIAEQYFQKALSLSNDKGFTRSYLITSLLKQKKYDQALEQSKIFVQERPDYYMAWRKLGYSLIYNGDLEHGYQAFQKAVEINPDDSNSRDMIQKIQAQSRNDHP